MKHLYFTIVLTLTIVTTYAQGYNFGIIHQGAYNFKIVAVPDFNSNGATELDDVGFTLILPTGDADVINHMNLIPNGSWTVQQFDAAFLTSQSLGDGTKDVFLFNFPTAVNSITHNSGDMIDLVSFDITNSPTSGEISIMLNSDPIAMSSGGVLDSFYNVTLPVDGQGNYYSGLEAGLESFDFNTLSDNTVDAPVRLSVYPNPATDVVNIDTSETVSNIEFYNILGKRVLQTTKTQNIPVNRFEAGIYLIKIKTDKGEISKRIIKE